MQIINHSWRNGGDDSKKPTVIKNSNGRYIITSDCDCDADGSPRATKIDPSCGQGETSLRRSNGWKGKEQYVNSETIPFFVLPLNWAKVTGDSSWHMGDMAKLTYKDKSIYAIFADQGPTSLIGEASIFAIEQLGFNPWNKEHTRVYTGIPHGVIYEYIPGSANLERTIDNESIQAYGRELFEGAAPQPLPIPDNAPVKDYSINFEHLKNVHADIALSNAGAALFWSALQAQIKNKEAFNMRVNLGTIPSYGNAQCAVTTASVLEGAAIQAGLSCAELFSKAHREKGEFALTHQIEIMLKRLGFVMYSKANYIAPQGAIGLMAGRYDFAGCKQHSGHVYSIYEDKGVGQHDIICDNGGWNHTYVNLTESFFVPGGIVVQERKTAPTPVLVLKNGVTNPAVIELKKILNTKFGSKLTTEGELAPIFGDKTEAEVKRVQAILQLPEDGCIHEDDLKLLRSYVAPEAPETDYNMMLVDEASKWIGVHEKGGNNHGPEVEEFQKAVDGKASGEAWCMAFQQFCIKKVEAKYGIKSKIFRSEHCLTTWRNSPAEMKTQTPHPGYIIIWQHGTTDNGHTGCIKSINADGKLVTIEGNTSDGVGINRDGDGVYSRVRNNGPEGNMTIKGFLKPFI